jgi:hypothetical protein
LLSSLMAHLFVADQIRKPFSSNSAPPSSSQL